MAGTRSKLVLKQAQRMRRWANEADARVARSGLVLRLVLGFWVVLALAGMVWVALNLI